MCEYCGCQQIAAIDELTREHDAVVVATALIRSRLETGRTDEWPRCAATCLPCWRRTPRSRNKAFSLRWPRSFPIMSSSCEASTSIFKRC